MSSKPSEVDVTFTLRVPVGSTDAKLRKLIETSGISERFLSWAVGMGWAPLSYEQHAEPVPSADPRFSLVKMNLKLVSESTATPTRKLPPTGKLPAVQLPD